ncbi:MAG: glycoside hydrolase family 95 protein [Firmicutes bacterium]|nr:glycoside hydrolase family 95 protein [Bacillota bacterium]
MASVRKPKTALIFDKPSSWWGGMFRGALPAGNGTVGAAVYGGAAVENILINRADLLWQGHVGVLPDVADSCAELKRCLENGRWRKASEVLNNALVAKPYRPVPAVPLPLCDLRVTMPAEKVREYNRVLNMETGEITVSFKDGSTRYERSLFVARGSDIVAYEITKSGSKFIEADFSLVQHDRGDSRTPESFSKLPESAVSKYDKFFMYFAARSDDGTDFGAVARLNHYGGTMEVLPDGIKIKGAERIFVIVKVFSEGIRDKEWKKLQAELTAVKQPYEKLFKEHAAAHARLFNAASLDFDADGRDESSESLLYKVQAGGAIPAALLEKLWDFGRYLLISGTSPTGAARLMSPYGLWCGEYKAVDGAVNTFSQLSALTAPALALGIESALLGYFAYLEEHRDDLKKNASRLYGARGLFVPQYIAYTSGLIGDIDPKNLHFTAGAAVAARLFYEYYLFTRDQKFLKERALPFMKEAALFYEEFFLSVDGKYMTMPSYSPGNTPANLLEPGGGPDIAASCSIDFDAARELFTNLISASCEFGLYKTEYAKWEEILAKIPPSKIGADGLVKEYHDPRMTENHATGSLLPLYPVYPGLSPSDDAFARAAALTMKKRDAGGGKLRKLSDMSARAHIYARLKDAEAALDAAADILRGFMMDNLICAGADWRGMGVGVDSAWAPYTIEGNTALSSVISEMLLQSGEDFIRLLPAAPEHWRKGSFAGWQTRAGVEIDFEWDTKRGTASLKIKPKKQAEFVIEFPQGTKRVKGPDAERFNPQTCKLALFAPALKAIAYEIKF